MARWQARVEAAFMLLVTLLSALPASALPVAPRPFKTPDVDNRYALAAKVFTGVAARIDLDKGAITTSTDAGFAAPHRSLTGLAVYAGQGA